MRAVVTCGLLAGFLILPIVGLWRVLQALRSPSRPARPARPA